VRSAGTDDDGIVVAGPARRDDDGVGYPPAALQARDAAVGRRRPDDDVGGEARSQGLRGGTIASRAAVAAAAAGAGADDGDAFAGGRDGGDAFAGGRDGGSVDSGSSSGRGGARRRRGGTLSFPRLNSGQHGARS
jgi:hypothetical protein